MLSELVLDGQVKCLLIGCLKLILPPIQCETSSVYHCRIFEILRDQGISKNGRRSSRYGERSLGVDRVIVHRIGEWIVSSDVIPETGVVQRSVGDAIATSGHHLWRGTVCKTKSGSKVKVLSISRSVICGAVNTNIVGSEQRLES